jgi:hypothetical protein
MHVFVSYLTIWLHIVIQINFRKHRRGNQKRTSRETGNIGYTRRRKIKQKHNTICVGHPFISFASHLQSLSRKIVMRWVQTDLPIGTLISSLGTIYTCTFIVTTIVPLCVLLVDFSFVHTTICNKSCDLFIWLCIINH